MQQLKGYIDGVAIAGAPDSSETVKGIVEEATQAEMDAGTDTGSTGAKLFVPPSKIQAYVSNNTLVSSQTLITGVTFSSSAHKIYNSTHKILAVISPATSTTVNVTTFKFDSRWRVLYRNSVTLTVSFIDSNRGIDFDGEAIYLSGINYGTNSDTFYVNKFSVNTTTGVVNTSPTTGSRIESPEDSSGFGSLCIVDATHVYAFGTLKVCKFDKSTLAFVSVSSVNFKDSDGTTDLTRNEFTNKLQRMNAGGTEYYFIAGGTYLDFGFAWTSGTNTLQKAASVNIGLGNSNVCINDTYLGFTNDSSLYMNLFDSGDLITTTL
jgi:Tfp pilus assembly protein PilV